MKNTFKRRLAILVCAVLLMCIIPVQKVNAASAIKNSDLRFTLNKGKKVTFQSYVPSIGMKEHTAQLTKYSAQKGTAVFAIDNKQHDVTRLRATIVVTLPSFTVKEAQKLASSKSNTNIALWDVSLLDLKTGKMAFCALPGDSGMSDVIGYTPMHYKKVKIGKKDGKGVYYKYCDKYKVIYDCIFLNSDKVALGIYGSTKKGATDNSKGSLYYAGNLSFKKTYWYSKSNKNLSSWKKIN